MRSGRGALDVHHFSPFRTPSTTAWLSIWNVTGGTAILRSSSHAFNSARIDEQFGPPSVPFAVHNHPPSPSSTTNANPALVLL